jgi:hypothetical protein
MPEKSGPCLPWCFQHNRPQYILIGFLVAVIFFLFISFLYRDKKEEKRTLI